MSRVDAGIELQLLGLTNTRSIEVVGGIPKGHGVYASSWMLGGLTKRAIYYAGAMGLGLGAIQYGDTKWTFEVN